MKDNQIMNVEDFMDMFILVNYLRENRCINIDDLKRYLRHVFKKEKSDQNYSFSFDILDAEIDTILNKMINEGLVSRVIDYEYLIRIHDQIPIKDILNHKMKYLGAMTKFVNSFVNYGIFQDKNNYLLIEDEDNFLEIDDELVKRKVKKTI